MVGPNTDGTGTGGRKRARSSEQGTHILSIYILMVVYYTYRCVQQGGGCGVQGGCTMICDGMVASGY